jgi:hypothetical protein
MDFAGALPSPCGQGALMEGALLWACWMGRSPWKWKELRCKWDIHLASRISPPHLCYLLF